MNFNKIFACLSSSLLMINPFFDVCNAIKMEIFSDDCSFIVDTNKGTAKLWKIYIGANEKKMIIVPRYVHFVNSNFKVVNVHLSAVENVKGRLVKLFLPDSLKKTGLLDKIGKLGVETAYYFDMDDVSSSDDSTGS